MPHHARHIRGFLRNSSATAALLDEIQRRDSLLEQVRRNIPTDIRSHCKQASVRDGQLTLTVDSPAWVARLKFLSPQILSGLIDGRDRERITERECRVQVIPEQTRLDTTNHTDTVASYPNAARHLLLASACVKSPELAESLKRLARSLSAENPRR